MLLSDLRPFKRSSRQLFWKATMSCPSKSEPARERDPRKTPNVPSRWWWWDLNCSFLIHHSGGTLLVQITRSIQLLKKQILKYSTRRFILETHEEAFNTYWHYLDLRQTADQISGFLIPLLRHLPGNCLSSVYPQYTCCNLFVQVTPRAPPLHGCVNGHHVCTTCLLKAGNCSWELKEPWN